MAKYLVQGTYSQEGVKGILNEGGSKRREAMEKAAKAMGGTLEAVYFAFGDVDIFVILDLPDNVTATAASLVVNATGTVKATYTVLITPEEVDQAAEKAGKLIGEYRAPGQ
jgi:uncharacterized protein with GYD domain